MTARGYFVYTPELLTLLNEILADAAFKKSQTVIIGNPDMHKLEGLLLAAHSIKEAIFNLERYGEFTEIDRDSTASKEEKNG